MKGIDRGDSVSQVRFIESIFGITAQSNVNDVDHSSLEILATEPLPFCDTNGYLRLSYANSLENIDQELEQIQTAIVKLNLKS